MKSYFKILVTASQLVILTIVLLSSFISKADHISLYNQAKMEETIMLDANEIPVNFYTRFPVLGLNRYFIHYNLEPDHKLDINAIENTNIDIENIEKPLHQAHYSGISQYLHDEKNENKDFEIIKIHFK